MTEHCCTCGSPVVIKSSGGGTTHWYEPVSAELLCAANNVLELWGNSTSPTMNKALKRLKAAAALCEKEAL